MELEPLQTGTVVRETHWNDHVSQINENTNTLSAQAGQLATLESRRTGIGYGSWTDNNAGNLGQKIQNTGTPGGSDDQGAGFRGVKHTDISTVLEAPSNCSLSNGTFTAGLAGKWLFTATAQYIGGPTAIRAIYLAKGNAANSPSGAKYGLLGVPEADSQATSTVINLQENEQVSMYIAVWERGASVSVWRSQGNVFTAVYLGP